RGTDRYLTGDCNRERAPLTAKCSAPLDPAGVIHRAAADRNKAFLGVVLRCAWRCLISWNLWMLRLQEEFLQRKHGSWKMGRVVSSQSQDQYGTADKRNIRIMPGSYTEQ
ncbi:unnamed protein product, partial [Staurois parvus]